MMERIQYADFTTRLRHLCVRNSLSGMPRKYKDKLIIAWCIAKSIDADREYNEQEINLVILNWLAEHTSPESEDYVTPRRFLVDLGFLERNADGSAYRVNPEAQVWNTYDPRLAGLEVDGFLAEAAAELAARRERTDG